MIGAVRGMRALALFGLLALPALLTGCGSNAVRPAAGSPGIVPVAPGPAANPSQDGPPTAAEIPPNVAEIPDAVPVPEPKSNTGNPDSYEVYGDHYIVLKDARGYKERGYASWYGKKFQGRRTSSGEPYDMFKMTAAHKTLPIPCYARVTNLDNGRSVVVRINDRGPFHSGRIIDLSYTAAVKLGVLGKGSIPVEVEALDPNVPATQYAAAQPAPRPAPPPPRPAPTVTAAMPTGAAVPAAAPVAATPAAPAAVVTAQTAPRPPAATGAPGPVAAAAAATTVASAAPASSAAPAAAPPAAAASQGLAGLRYLQAGLFNDPINAITMREQLTGLGIGNVQLKSDTRNGASVSRVLIGPFLDDDTLAAVRKRLLDLRLPAVPVVE